LPFVRDRFHLVDAPLILLRSLDEAGGIEVCLTVWVSRKHTAGAG
jgi:hypothetical protein